MNLLKISWNNLKDKKLSTLLSVVLFALGVAIISMLLLLSSQMENQLTKNHAGIDAVVGAKGSPMQLILSSIFHVDYPTGNINLQEAQKLAKNRMIKDAIPLSLGDSYKTFRIVGTDYQLHEMYEGKLKAGRLWQNDLEATIGSEVAAKTGLHIGVAFHGAHGMEDDDDLLHKHDDYVVVGEYAPTGTVLDQMITTSIQSVWKVHETPLFGEEAEEDQAGHGGHEGHDDHAGHDHGHDHVHAEIPPGIEGFKPKDFRALKDSTGEKEITSLLINFASTMAAVTMPRMINKNTNMQIATPSIETTRLLKITGMGIETMTYLAYLIIIISGFSVFISLFKSLKDRKYELALMRTMGASKFQLLSLILMEGLLIALLGFIIGMLISHIGVQFLGNLIENNWRYSFRGLSFHPGELWLLIGSLLIGLLAAVIPAIQAYRTDISRTLSTY